MLVSPGCPSPPATPPVVEPDAHDEEVAVTAASRPTPIRVVADPPCVYADGRWRCAGELSPLMTGPLWRWAAGFRWSCALDEHGVRCVDEDGITPVTWAAGARDIAGGAGLCALVGDEVRCGELRDAQAPARLVQPGAERVTRALGWICAYGSGEGRCQSEDGEREVDLEGVDAAVGSCRLTGALLRCPGPVALAGVVDVQAGDDFTCALRDDATVQCWGQDGAGQLGRSYVTGASYQPARVWGLADVEELHLGEQRACARTGSGDLRCWGRDPQGEVRAAASDPWKPPVDRFAGARACVTEHPRDVARRLRESSTLDARVDILEHVGLDPRDAEISIVRDPWIMPDTVERADSREVDLDGDSISEWILEVVLVFAEPHGVAHRRFMAQVFRRGPSDGWCPLLTTELSASNNHEHRPAELHPRDPPMTEPIELSFVRLLSPDRVAIRERRQDGYVHHYPFRSEYTTSFWALDGARLERVFGPFATFSEEHGDDWSRETVGTVKLRGGKWPRSVFTRVDTRCDEPGEGRPCERAKTTRWIWEDGSYRPR